MVLLSSRTTSTSVAKLISPKMISVKLLKVVLIVSLFLLIILSVHPGRFAAHYPYINQADVWDALVSKMSKNLSLPPRMVCDYVQILDDNSDVVYQPELDETTLTTEHLKVGGEYVPIDCKPLFSTAIIVPYRDRDRQLKDFLTHMHIFLRKQNIHYRIYVIEQDDTKGFNRAKLLNIGAVIAMKHGFPCLVLHDVDLLPIKSSNIYACTKLPRHMSSSLDKFRFNLPYESLFGGAISILADQFVTANGMSNNYYGWGAEDDDFYQRLDAVQLIPCRFDPGVSRYTMMRHKPEVASPMKNNLLATARMRYLSDGLNSLKYVEKSRKLHALFTHVVVEV